MGTVDTGTALLILVGFVLPGFVAVLIKERIYEVRGEESGFDRLLTTAYYSVLVWAIPALAGVIAGVDRGELEKFFSGRSPLWVAALVAASVLLVVPAGAAYGAWRWMNSSARQTLLGGLRIGRAHRFPSSWDWAFDTGQDFFLVVTLRDGTRIAGYYGTRSHSGYGTKLRDLFLEERWDISDDGRELEGPAPGNLGVWISAEDIVAVEQYALNDEQRDEIAQRKA
jgi:uncharacterized protein DUF6338